MGFALSPDPDAEPGDELRRATTSGALRYGHFEVAIGADGHPIELGAGAMAVTYRARDTILDRAVALKVIDHALANNPAARARFLREARAAAQLHHPNVANVTHYGEQDGECYYAMELIEGETLEQRVRRDGPLSPDLVLEIAVQIARGLAAGEACGLVHRDLKPSNIMLEARGAEHEGDAVSVKVIDYGLAKGMAAESPLALDQTRGGFVGTPGFASPEQFARTADERVDTRADIYSLGATLWYLLSGRMPFVGRALDEIHRRQLEDELPLEQLESAKAPPCLVDMLKSMLAADLKRAAAIRARTTQSATPVPAARIFAAPDPATPLARARCRGCPYRGARVRSRVVEGRPQPSSTIHAVGCRPAIRESQSHRRRRLLRGRRSGGSRTAIASFGSLKVIGPRSTQAYPPKERDFPKIGRELGVDHVVEGSVWRGEGRIQISARLVECATGAVVWSREYERPLEDVFAVRGEIVSAVAQRMGLRLSASEKAALAAAPTRDPHAYDLLLRSRQVPRSSATTAVMRTYVSRRIAFTEEAVARDPSFALAFCELARLHAIFYSLRAGATPEQLGSIMPVARRRRCKARVRSIPTSASCI
jgi:serine/threonine protein kinase